MKLRQDGLFPIDSGTKRELNEVHIARSLAIFLVVMLHASGAYFLTFSDSWNLITTYSSFTRQCIGLFFIITGYLYYAKEIDATSHIRKGFINLVVPFSIWWLFYFLYNGYFNNLHVNSIFQPTEVHLWFMYAYICIFMFLPIISNPLKKLPTHYILTIIAMIFYVQSFVPYAHRAFFSLHWLNLDFISENGVYILVGALIRRYKDKIATHSSIIYLFLNILMCFMTAFATYWWSHKMGKPEQLFFKNTAPFVFFSAITTFMFCVSVSNRVSPNLMCLLKKISNVSFGIYFIHFIFVRQLKLGYNIHNAWYMIPTLTLVYFTLSYAICILISKFKISRLIL
ncbi:acyltransferase family protein [Escherichia coli]|nr:acyltransferase family protein [Escherichia coli]